MGIGGAYAVRGYPQGEASGDQGWLGSMELRYSWAPPWHTGVFVDHGQVTINKNPWSSADNRRSLGATGLTLGWAQYGWQFNAVAAWRLSSGSRSDTDKKPRFWMQLTKSF
jgi:hemolysin activation/secretion protein